MPKAANVTKYDAGGTGDNIIADGFIKTVEKVWIDSYAGTAAIPSGTVIDIAVIPENKKITGIDLYFPAAISGNAATGTGTTMSLGYRNAAGTTSATLFLNAGECLTATKKLSADAVAGINYITAGGTNVITLLIGRLATTVTGSTAAPLIKSIVRYT
jgi:hypothetical protein